MSFNILILAGYSGSGKTTIAKRISQEHNLGFIEHQKLIHEKAVSKGYLRARYWLKEVGIKDFVDESLREVHFRMENFRDLGIKGVVIDVVYGKSMIDNIAGWFPESKVCVAVVNTDQEVRETRLMSRMGGVERNAAYIEREFRDGFLTDVGLREVFDCADFEVNNNGNLCDTISDLYAKLESIGIELG